MSDASASGSLRRIIDVLEMHGVEYMLIGGQAEVLMGSPRITYDTDIAYSRETDNLARLAAALRALNAKLRVSGTAVELQFPIDERSLALGNNFTFTTDAEDLDVLGYIAPLGEYPDLLPNHEVHTAYGFAIKTIGLDDLIKVKQHVARKKDSESLYQLLAIKRVREEMERREKGGA
jgi:predicted nucleotidyltransferase